MIDLISVSLAKAASVHNIITAERGDIMNETELTAVLKNFLDSSGRLTAFPAKRKMKLYALVYLAGKLPLNTNFTEKEINARLNEWHTFSDPATLRRELFNHCFLNRDPYGRAYRMEDVQPTLEELERKYC